MHAVIFAAYVNDASYLPMLQKILEVFCTEMRHCRFYVGINPCVCQNEIIAAFEATELDFVAAVVPKGLVLTTDASAYQAALRLMREEGKAYDLVWFTHTKGANSKAYTDLVAQLIELYLKNEAVQKVFMEHPKCGVYATSGVVLPAERPFLRQYISFRYPPLLLSPLYSCYVIRGALLYNFLMNCDASFFDAPLPSGHFFEFDLPQIAFQQGYLPVVQQVVQVHHAELQLVRSNARTYQSVLEKWMTANGLRGPVALPDR